ncbi:MAG: glycosyltransferase family 4 protein [Bacteroidaceae bacterium]|nr:glycosyltransferase family 4 protein [Bacteroidaceae bacterium]
MRILFLTDNFPPEVNAPATRTYEHAREWVKMGHEVTVITCAPNFPRGKVFQGYKNRWHQEETIDGIRVIRVWSFIAPNRGIVKRLIDFISFSVTSFLAGLRVKTDLIVATSPQFFTALSGRALSWIRRIPWVMEVRDLWPESIKAVGAAKLGPFIRYFEWEEFRCYKSARKIIVVTDSFREQLIKRGIFAHKIEVVKNGCNRDLFHPVPKESELLQQLGLLGKTVIGYIGTLGMAHKLDFILRCAKALEAETKYHFLIMGDGAKKEELLQLKEELQLTNVTFHPPVPKQQVSRYVGILDVALINLRRSDTFLSVIPSKIFENAGMEIPILMGVQGEAQKIIESYGAGRCFIPENEESFIKELHALTDNPAEYEKCKEGCQKLAADFDRKVLARQMMEHLLQAYELRKR